MNCPLSLTRSPVSSTSLHGTGPGQLLTHKEGTASLFTVLDGQAIRIPGENDSHLRISYKTEAENKGEVE